MSCPMSKGHGSNLPSPHMTHPSASSSHYLPPTEPSSITSHLNELFHYAIRAPAYHLALEAILIIWVLWLIFRKPKPVNKDRLSEKEKEELIREWTPEPLVPVLSESERIKLDYALNSRIVTNVCAKKITVDGKECINMASQNYLGLAGDEELTERALAAVDKYGVGSCGPRGFYGTVDVHLELESRLAQFTDTEEAVLYSFGFSAVASAIPAYARIGDIIFADEACHFAIQKGIQAARCNVKCFKHNSMADLERLLQDQEKFDRKNPNKAKSIRRFIVVEGLYMNEGDICPLPDVVTLGKRYKARIFLDEAISFGYLGQTGRGVTEFYNVSVKDIDMISGSLEYGLAAYGGFCVGTHYVVDHQRLAGLGYCFSASQPPLQAVVAIAALDRIQTKPELLDQAKDFAVYTHSQIQVTLSHFDVAGVPLSPVKHLRLKPSSFPHLLASNSHSTYRNNGLINNHSNGVVVNSKSQLNAHVEPLTTPTKVTAVMDRQAEIQVLESIVSDAQEKESLCLTVARYLENEEQEPLPRPSIRLTINPQFTKAEMDLVLATIHRLSSKYAHK